MFFKNDHYMLSKLGVSNMKTSLSLKTGVSFEVNTDSQHSFLIDGSPDIGGQDLGARPMELILAGLGGCTALDVIHILRKARQNVIDLKVNIDGQRADTIPKVFTEITLSFLFIGDDLSTTQVERAVKLSAQKYCSVGKMLEKSVKIHHFYSIVNTQNQEVVPSTCIDCSVA